MCGIVGYISNRHHEKEIEHAVQEMYHRGPDNQQVQLLEFRNQKIGLGHARLSILDLDPRSHQPFSINEGQYVIIFNGEIYNYRSIKKDLEDRGVEFTTQSDTEVFLKAYETFGIECVKEFRGIFTAVIFDKENEKLFLIRDQIGIKPLYYFKDQKGNLFFASELKSLFTFSSVERIISKLDICQFLNMGFVIEPRTGFENVLKVKPGSYIAAHGHSLSETSYYEPSIARSGIKNDVNDKIKHACQEQELADVPLALLYSGGLDSSVLASKLKSSTTSLFFENSKEEIKSAGLVDDKYYALKIAEQLDLDLELIQADEKDSEDLLAEIEYIASKVEEPISDYTFVASEKICRKARELGYKVVISGMGGDEAFGGYPRYILAKNYSLLRKIRFLIRLIAPLLSRHSFFSKKIKRLLSFLKEDLFALGYIRMIGYLSSDEINSLLHENKLQIEFEKSLLEDLEKYENCSYLKQAMVLDYSGFLSHNLIVADKSSMLASVEMRVPLLDLDVYQSGLEKADEFLISGADQKLILQEILIQKVPKKYVSRPKAGFNPPLDSKINQIGMERIIKEFSSGLIGNYLNIDPLKKIVSDHFDGLENNTYKIWQLLFLNAWLKVWTERR